MQKFQQLIIKQNQIVLNNFQQNLILIFQFVITLIWTYIALQQLASNNGEILLFQFLYYFSLPTLSIFFEIQLFIVQTITLIFSLICLITILFAKENKWSMQLMNHVWLSYPNVLQLVVIHNSAYSIFQDNVNFSLAILNIILAVFISQMISLYSFHQNNSQILLRGYLERSTIPLAYSLLAFIAGITIKSDFLAYVYLTVQLGFDLYFGPIYYFFPHMQFIKLSTTKITVLLSMLRAPVVGFSIFYRGNELFYFAFFFIPIMIKLHFVLWDQRFIALINKRNMYFQYVCLDKQRENTPMAETYLAYFFEIITYKQPLNRILMLSLFCNHLNLCKNLKCFCQNKQFYENVQVTTSLSIDLSQIKQQINYFIGEGEITLCYKQLILLFLNNFIQNSRFTPIQETLILELSLFEVESFKCRLFQSKIRFHRLIIQYPQYHPLFIQRLATKQLITQELQKFIGNNQQLILDVSVALQYFRLFDDINLQMYEITREKLAILDILKQNYQNSQPYIFHQEVTKYVVNSNRLELQIQQLISMNGKAEEVRDLQNDFYSLIKIDFNRRNVYKNKLMPFINSNPTAFAICQYESQLKIVEYSSNFIQMINLNSQIKGLEIETIVPAPLQNYHRVAVASMIETGQTKLVNKGQYQLLVKSEKYILEVDALLRYDFRDLNDLKFIGFMQQRDKDSIIILASESGKVDSYSRSAGTLLHLNSIDLTILNYFQLSPYLAMQKEQFEFDGFLVFPTRSYRKDMLTHYRHYISYPDECFVFLVNAEHKTQIYSSAKIHSLKINSFYQLKENDFKVIALDLMIRQIMIFKKINKSQYALQQDVVRKIETFRKTLRIKAAEQAPSEEEEFIQYDLEQGDDSERNVQQKESIKYLMPDVLPSLDSVRTQQEKLVITMDQYNSYPILAKESDSNQKSEAIDFGSKSEQETISRPVKNTHKLIEIELEASEDQNIEEQFNIIQKCVKQQRTRTELIQMKNLRKNGNIKASTWHGNGQLQQQKQLIVAIVNAFQSTKFNLIIYLQSFSPLMVIINIAFIIGFILNSITELEGIQMDSNNTTYPLILLSDINIVLIGLQLADWEESSFDISQFFIDAGSNQYHNMSIYVNDLEMDYHLFLQELDEENITVIENGIEIIYKARYFFKNYMIFKLRTIEEDAQNIWGIEPQFIFKNYPLIADKLWDLRDQTTYDVVQRMEELTYGSDMLLIFSILSNFFATFFYIYLLFKLQHWRNKLYSTFFLFGNIQSIIDQLNSKIDHENEFNTLNVKNEEKNKKIENILRFQKIMKFLILLILSLGFYIPLFIYIDSVKTDTLNFNQLLTDVAMMQLKQSTTLNWYFVNQTNQEYDKVLISNTSIISQVINDCTESEQLILYVIPFDDSYNYFPQIQQYSTTPLCNCSLLNGQLQNGYNGFYQYVFQHLTDSNQLIDIMQAYQIVVDYQISTKSEYDDFMQARLANTIYNMELILIIGVVSILILQTTLLACLYQHQKRNVIVAKSSLHLFSPQIVSTNKYTLQMLLQYGIK